MITLVPVLVLVVHCRDYSVNFNTNLLAASLKPDGGGRGYIWAETRQKIDELRPYLAFVCLHNHVSRFCIVPVLARKVCSCCTKQQPVFVLAPSC